MDEHNQYEIVYSLTMIILGTRILFRILFRECDEKSKKLKSSLYQVGLVKSADFEYQKLNKIIDTIWKIIFYILSCSLVIFYCIDLNLFHNPDNSWIYNSKTESVEFTTFYLFELSYYIAGVFSLILGLEEKRSDVKVLYLHHFATIFLIGASFIMGFEKIGILVLFCHDFSDLFLEIGKLFIYWEVIESITTVWYLLLLFIWIATRVVYFPFWVIWTCWFQAGSLSGYPTLHSIPWEINLNTFIFVLIGLLMMNLYWTFALISLGYRKLMKGDHLEDHRESKIKKIA